MASFEPVTPRGQSKSGQCERTCGGDVMEASTHDHLQEERNMREDTTQGFLACLAALVALLLTLPNAVPGTWAASHREAPLIALDPAADNTDVYCFRSWEDPRKVVFIANVIPGQEPGDGPNYFNFDDNV